MHFNIETGDKYRQSIVISNVNVRMLVGNIP